MEAEFLALVVSACDAEAERLLNQAADDPAGARRALARKLQEGCRLAAGRKCWRGRGIIG
jgi:hypothetical protein